MEKYLSKDGLEYLIEGLDPRYAKERDLADVAKSGSYDDLTDKPSIPSTPGDIDAMPASTTLADLGGIALTEKGANSGVAPLNAGGKIDSQYLPSYVDDVIECYVVDGYEAFSANWLSKTDGGNPLLPEGDKIYVILSSGDYLNKVYRWGGTAYVSIGGDIDLSAYATQTWVQNQNYLTSHQDISGKANSADLATVATSGDYTDLINKPTIPRIPSNVSEFTNDAGYLTQHQSLSGYATETWVGNQGFLTSHQDISGKVDSSDLADVATSGDYDDLINKPTIPNAYTLPTASTSVLGGVKVDGTSIGITDGVISIGDQSKVQIQDKIINLYRKPEYINADNSFMNVKSSICMGQNNIIQNTADSLVMGANHQLVGLYQNIFLGENLRTQAAKSIHTGVSNVSAHGTGNNAIPYRFTIGNGQPGGNRSNLFGIDNEGNILTSGNIYVGCSDLSALEGNNKVAITDEGVIQESYDEFIDENENSDILKDGSTHINGKELVVSQLVYSPADNSLEQELRTVIGGGILCFEAMNPLTQIPLSRSLQMDSNGQLLWNGNPLSSTNYTAGANIQINNGVISATDTTYSAGNGISINNGVISASGSSSYTAGNGIDITNGEISFNDAILSDYVLAQQESVDHEYMRDIDEEAIIFDAFTLVDERLQPFAHSNLRADILELNYNDYDNLMFYSASLDSGGLMLVKEVADPEVDEPPRYEGFLSIADSPTQELVWNDSIVITENWSSEDSESFLRRERYILDDSIQFNQIRLPENDGDDEFDIFNAALSSEAFDIASFDESSNVLSAISITGAFGIAFQQEELPTENNPEPAEPILGELNMDNNGDLCWNGNALAFAANVPEIPSAPVVDGTYMLICEVTNGEPAYSWESVSIGGSY